MYDLLTLGEMLMRLSPAVNERLVTARKLDANVGGAELNVAAGASLLGLKTGMISVLPDNTLGANVRREIKTFGVDDTYIAADTAKDARLGLYYYEYGAAPRKPSVVYDRKNTSVYKMTPDMFPDSMYANTRCFHTSGITLALSPEIRDAAVELMKRFKQAGALISFDVNFRGNLWTGEQAKETIEKILPMVDIFFCSESTARLTFGKEGEGIDQLKSFAAEYPMQVIAATRRVVHSPKSHAFSSIVYDCRTGKAYEEEPYDNIDVVDRIGSGDAFVGGFLYGYLRRENDEDGADRCALGMTYGNASAALKETVPGDLPVTDKRECDAIIAEHRNTGEHLEMNR